MAAAIRGVLLGLVALLPATAQAADEAAIKKAIERGVAYLKSQQQPDGRWAYTGNTTLGPGPATIGATALAALTLLECDVSPDDVAIQRAAALLRVQAVALQHTYAISLCLMFFDRLGDVNDNALIQALTVRLLRGQTADGGWTYSCLQPVGGTDNSNTQFATLALWVGRRHGLKVGTALEGINLRFRQTQHADGGWGYRNAASGGPPGMRGGPSHSTGSMTCAGLLGLAVAYGAANEAILRTQPGKGPSPARPKQPLEPRHDPRILAALAYLGSSMDELSNRWAASNPAVPRVPVPAIPGQPPPPPPLSVDYYFLWSLERVGMALGLKTIGERDWYAWGSEVIVNQQQPDGSWQGNYPSGGADTCFALLLLRRSNLAPDLTASLKGKVRDPGRRELRAGGPPRDRDTEPEPSEKPDRQASRKEPTGPRLIPPEEKDGQARTPAQPSEDNKLDTEAAQLRDELVRAGPERQGDLIEKLRDSKGAVNTDALAAAIPRLSGDVKTKARDALAERLTRMTTATLRDKLQDDSLEIRRAAALAAAMKGDKELVPDLVKLLNDPEAHVWRAAAVALKQLTGQDFGPAAGADETERSQAAGKWRAWWNEQNGSSAEEEKTGDAKPRGDEGRIQGAWVAVSVERMGLRLSKAQLRLLKIRLVFDGDSITIDEADRSREQSFQLDPSTRPKQIDITNSKEATVSKGIYTLSGDQLKICYAPPGMERPSEFKSQLGTAQTLLILKRPKKKS